MDEFDESSVPSGATLRQFVSCELKPGFLQFFFQTRPGVASIMPVSLEIDALSEFDSQRVVFLLVWCSFFTASNISSIFCPR